MKSKGLIFVAIACLAVGVLSFDASASGRNPASCLLFPVYDTGNDCISVMTITNTCDTDLVVRLVWVDDNVCTPEDQWLELTAGDTFSFLDRAMNPQKDEEGFMYCYVVESVGSKMEVDSDCLIGQEFIFKTFSADQKQLNYGINAVGFKALNVVKDGLLHLNGTEYEAAPSKVMFPRFFGQNPFYSHLILINLTGGQWFWQQADVLVYNDNEQPFSSTVYFPCWADMCLKDVSDATNSSNLYASNHDPLELWDGNNNPNDPHVKTGWLHLIGDFVWNPQTSFVHDDPSLYAVLVEGINGWSAADLPWQLEDVQVFKYASLWSTNPMGSF